MNNRDQAKNQSEGRIPPGICPICRNPVARSVIVATKEFPCPNCYRLIRTTALLRNGLNWLSISGATLAAWLLPWPWLIKILIWPLIRWCLLVALITLTMMTWNPQLVEFYGGPVKKDGPFQTLDLDK